MPKLSAGLIWSALMLSLFFAPGCAEEGEKAPCAGIEGIGGECVAGKGECSAKGKYICAEDGKSIICDVLQEEPAEEICDNLDNDCDGDTDEELTGAGQAECSDKGVCSSGVSTFCVDGSWACLYSELDGYEEDEKSCDNLDNDCDGETDESLTDFPENLCTSEGVCSSGLKVACAEGVWSCNFSEIEGYEEEETICDLLDNDCDGATDEDLLKEPDTSCRSDGVCEKGVKMTCVEGDWTCDYSEVQGYQPVEIACDELDNDCDGFLDEDGVCGIETCYDIPAGTIKCSYPVGGTTTPAVGDDGTIYVTATVEGSNTPRLFAINSADCTPRWEYTPTATEGEIFHCLSPAIHPDGKIYLSCSTVTSDTPNFIFVVNAEGTEEGVIILPELVFPSGMAIGDDGTIYLGNRYCCGKFYAYGNDGNQKWLLDTGGSEFDGPPAIGADGTIYAGTWKFRTSPEEKFYAISDDGTSGRIVWEFSPPEESAPYDTSGIFLNSYPALGSDGTIYVGILGKLNEELATTLYALSPQNGNKRWHSTFANNHASLNNSVAVGEDGAIYIISAQFGEYGAPVDTTTLWLHAIKPDGTEKWPAFPMRDFCWNASPAIGSDGKIYVAAQDRLYCINGDNGSEEWTLSIEGAGAPTTIGTSRAVYFLTTLRFYSVCSSSAGLATSPWPKMLHDRKNTGNFNTQ